MRPTERLSGNATHPRFHLHPRTSPRTFPSTSPRTPRDRSDPHGIRHTGNTAASNGMSSV
ncbi:hypothetical protein GCM10010344_18220 [Streptomyces bluensis]|nr:hypothetical protein GCM10010344_18220 [Streptomyces bluensis]